MIHRLPRDYLAVRDFDASVALIMEGTGALLTFERSYRAAYTATLDGRGQEVYDSTMRIVKRYCRGDRHIRREEMTSQANMIRDMALYNQCAYARHRGLPPFDEACMSIYQEHHILRRRRAAQQRVRRVGAAAAAARKALLELYIEVRFRPQNSGAKAARREFEAVAVQLA